MASLRRSILSSLFFTVAVVAGCAQESQPGVVCGKALEACGQYTDLGVLCSTQDACTIDGHPFACHDGCSYPVGHAVIVDLTTLALDENEADVIATGLTDPATFSLRLDGVDGVFRDAGFYAFPGHAGTPGTLEITAHGEKPLVTTPLGIEDAVCLQRVSAETPACGELE